MPGANFDRIKNWQEEILTHVDLNREIDNILENFNTDGMAGYSENAAEMQIQTDPGDVGSESLATSLSGEIERLRFVIQRILGADTDYWYEPPTRTLSELADAVDTLTQATSTHRIVSGLTTGNSGQLNALDPDGTAASVALRATTVPFRYYISDVLYSVDSDITVSGLLTAPSSNNTATVNEPLADDSQNTKFFGQFGSVIEIDSAGSEITSRVGQMAAFQKDNEIFIARIKSSTLLVDAFRGCFFNSSQARILPETLLDNDTITLLRLTWIFLNTSGQFVVTYNTPIRAAVQPSSAAVGDYWFDTVNNIWKTFNSVAWIDAPVTLIGMTAQNTTGTIAARTFDAIYPVSPANELRIERSSNSTAQTVDFGTQLNIAGKVVDIGYSPLVWNMASNLDAGISEAANTWYYLYLTEIGRPVISDQAPALRQNLQGLYHPHELWRAVGIARNDGSSNFTTVQSLRDVHDIPTPPVPGITEMQTESSGSFSVTNTTETDITNLSLRVHPTSRKVRIRLAGDPDTVQPARVGLSLQQTGIGAALTLFGFAYLRLYRNATVVGRVELGPSMVVDDGSTTDYVGSVSFALPVNTITFYDTPPQGAGPAVYKLTLQVDSMSLSVGVGAYAAFASNIIMVVEEA